MNNVSSLGARQRLIMEVLWEKGAATVQEVLDGMSIGENESPPAYTTILTLLQKLEKAGWVRHEKNAGFRAYRYRAAVGKGEAVRGTFAELAKRFFAGNSALLFRHLLDDEKLSETDRDEILAMIQEKK